MRKLKQLLSLTAGALVAHQLGPLGSLLYKSGEVLAAKTPKVAPGPTTVQPPPAFQIPTRREEIRFLLDEARRCAGHPEASRIPELGLHDQAVLTHLQHNILWRLEHMNDAEAANDWLVMMQLLRFSYPMGHNPSFYAEGLRLAGRSAFLTPFVPIFIQRDADITTRAHPDYRGIPDQYAEAGDWFEYTGETHGLFDCYFRKAVAATDRKDIDEATKLLIRGDQLLHSSDYHRHDVIARALTDNHADKEALLYRARARILKICGKHKEALRLLDKAALICRQNRQLHGTANIFLERALVLRSHESYANQQEAALWLHAAKRHFRTVGDNLLASECETLVSKTSELPWWE